MSATEGRRRVPILDPERERRAAKPGDVVTYTLSPEEIEARYGKKGVPEKTPVGVNMEKRAQEKRAEREAAKRETSDMPRELPISKEQYFEMRLGGMSRAEVAREIGLKYATDIYPMLGLIGLRDIKVEEEEMRKFAEQRAAMRKAVAPVGAKVLDELPQASDVSSRAQELPVSTVSSLADENATYEVGTSFSTTEDALDLSSFSWISPQFNRGREGVYLTKHDLRISGATAKPFESARFAQIGVKPGVVVVRVATVGWKVRRNNKASGVYIGGNLLQKALLSAGFSTKTTIEAMWDSYNGVLVCRAKG